MTTQNFSSPRMMSIEIQPIDSSTNLIWTFPYIAFLKDRKIYQIELSTDLRCYATGRLNMGYQISLDPTRSAFVTLYNATKSGEQFIQDAPACEFIGTSIFQVNNAVSANNYTGMYNTNGPYVIYPSVILWEKSFIKFPVATGLANYSIQFNITFEN